MRSADAQGAAMLARLSSQTLPDQVRPEEKL
jgi:hypothetical protein